jgi:hypothetical protein
MTQRWRGNIRKREGRFTDVAAYRVQQDAYLFAGEDLIVVLNVITGPAKSAFRVLEMKWHLRTLDHTFEVIWVSRGYFVSRRKDGARTVTLNRFYELLKEMGKW